MPGRMAREAKPPGASAATSGRTVKASELPEKLKSQAGLKVGSTTASPARPPPASRIRASLPSPSPSPVIVTRLPAGAASAPIAAIAGATGVERLVPPDKAGNFIVWIEEEETRVGRGDGIAPSATAATSGGFSVSGSGGRRRLRTS